MLRNMKKKIVLEWLVLIIILSLIIPILNSAISKNDEEWIRFLKIQIKFINLPLIFGLLFYQIWRFKKNTSIINTVYKSKD